MLVPTPYHCVAAMQGRTENSERSSRRRRTQLTSVLHSTRYNTPPVAELNEGHNRVLVSPYYREFSVLSESVRVIIQCVCR